MVLPLLSVFWYMCICMWLIFSGCDEFFSLEFVGALTSVILFVSVFLSTLVCVNVCERKFKTKKNTECVISFVCLCLSSGRILYENVSVCTRLITVFDRGK